MTLFDLLATAGITTVTLATLGIGVVKLFGIKWLDHRLAGRLEGVKLEGQKQLKAIEQAGQRELEATKRQHATMLDRAARLNQREFEVIPRIWEAITNAHFATLHLISIWQEHPDTTRMNDAQFESYVAGTRLQDWQKNELRAIDRNKRNDYLRDALKWLRVFDANTELHAVTVILEQNSIFLHPDTHTRLEGLVSPMRKATRLFTIMAQSGDEFRSANGEEEDDVQVYRKIGEDLYGDVARYLRERYWIKADGEAV